MVRGIGWNMLGPFFFIQGGDPVKDGPKQLTIFLYTIGFKHLFRGFEKYSQRGIFACLAGVWSVFPKGISKFLRGTSLSRIRDEAKSKAVR
ncbi:hypothetical protein D3C81_1628640 [compost metagenome]